MTQYCQRKSSEMNPTPQDSTARTRRVTNHRISINIAGNHMVTRTKFKYPMRKKYSPIPTAISAEECYQNLLQRRHKRLFDPSSVWDIHSLIYHHTESTTLASVLCIIIVKLYTLKYLCSLFKADRYMLAIYSVFHKFTL